MKYTVEIKINSSIEKVIELFDNSNNLMKWQTGLKRFDHISGIPGQEGAKSRLTYIENGRELEMIEIIIKNDLPENFSALYENKGVKNIINNQFLRLNSNETLWKLTSTFQFNGLMKLYGLFMRRAFPKQTLKDMTKFKTFVEGN